MIKILIFFTILSILLILWKRNSSGAPKEGFDQAVPFVLKRDNQIYDDFYATIYDEIHNTESKEIGEILQIVQPTKRSIFLDIGSGTGHLVNKLTQMGYYASGVDKSEAMVEQSTRNFPDINVHCGDVVDSMLFDRSTFTHIFCMNFTIYHIPDKTLFFKNCYYWLAPNGYLIVHLADRDKYNAVVAATTPRFVDNAQKYSKSRIIESNAVMGDFKYSNAIDLKNPGTVVVKERFTDIHTNNTRENELTLYMDDLNKIVDIAQKCGFIAHAQVNANGDKHQFVYVFERML